MKDQNSGKHQPFEYDPTETKLMITKNLGGSNLFTYDYSNPDAGLFSKYHIPSEREKIDTLFKVLLDSGQDCIQLIILLSQTPPNSVYTKFDGSRLDPQCQVNYENIIITLEKLKFKFIGIVPEFWHQDDFRKNQLTESQIEGHYEICESLVEPINVDYCIDLCAELDPSPRCIQNAQLLWTWWTEIHSPNAAPCWDATMSLMPNDDKGYQFVADIFKGADPNGAPNWPARINLHAYRNEAQRMLDSLKKVGMPRRNIYYGECFTILDQTEDNYCQDIHNTILANKDEYLFERVIQYPCRPMPVDAPEPDVLPTVFRYC